MFPVSGGVVVLGLLIGATVGLLVGVTSGALTSVVLRIPREGLIKDGILGAVALVATVIACALVPWPYNHVSYTLASGTVVQSTMNRYQHPLWAGLLLALLLPVSRQLFRLKQLRASRQEGMT